MTENHLLNLKLISGQLILIHLISGKAICGAYLDNYNSEKKEFDFENHGNHTIEKIKLSNIEELVI